jgi:hypothetical protein
VSTELGKHLELVQNIIDRMGRNSFPLKEWSIAFITAMTALAAERCSVRPILISAVPQVVFWSLDRYFLAQERMHRKFYDHIRGITDTSWMATGTKRYSLSPGDFNIARETVLSAMRRPTLIAFYGSLVGIVVTVGTFVSVYRAK